MPFSNRLRRGRATTGAERGVISEARHLFTSRVNTILGSLVLALLAGTAVSKAQQGTTPTALQADKPAAPGVDSVDVPKAGAAEAGTVTVTLSADHETRPVTVPAGSSVGALLKQENIVLGDLDRCSRPLSAPVAGGMHLWVARVKKQLTVEKTLIPFAVRQRYTGSLAVGKKTIATPGKNGEKVVTYRDLYRDGKRTERVKVAVKTTAPRTQVELVGVRGMSLASRGYFSGKRLVEMVATGYGPGENGPWGEQTASGLKPGRGVVAVDPRFIPLGTRLYVEDYGYCVAGDVGSAIKGNRIDLGMDSYREAQAVGRKRVHVLILD